MSPAKSSRSTPSLAIVSCSSRSATTRGAPEELLALEEDGEPLHLPQRHPEEVLDDALPGRDDGDEQLGAHQPPDPQAPVAGAEAQHLRGCLRADVVAQEVRPRGLVLGPHGRMERVVGRLLLEHAKPPGLLGDHGAAGRGEPAPHRPEIRAVEAR